METLVVATRNQGKLKEFQKMLGRQFKIISLEEFPHVKIIENGKTFDENALIKARTVMEVTGFPALGDDSGLEVLTLGCRPGIYSARFAGTDATDEENIKKLLFEMEDIPFEKRQARFVCSLALVFPGGKTFIQKGFLEGYITFEPKGSMGFGYDPVFFLPEYNKTVAEIPAEDKNRISHRAEALRKLRQNLDGYLQVQRKKF